MTLDQALKQFDLAEANLVRLEKIWAKIEAQIPEGISFQGLSPEQRAYDDLCRAFREVRDALPAIDGWRMTAEPMALDAIAQARLESEELGELGVTLNLEKEIRGSGEEIHEYRYRMNRRRRELVQKRVKELISEFDETLDRLKGRGLKREDRGTMVGPDWDTLCHAVQEFDRLLDASPQRGTHWSDFRRHLRFAEPVDFWDIVNTDWPRVKSDIEGYFAIDLDPLKVDLADLGTAVAEQPVGPVTTALNWAGLSDEDFERLMFNLISEAGGYENPEWLTKTRAPDRGRDLSVYRVAHDVLAGALRQRIIIQCKHWLANSVGLPEVSASHAAMALWDAPPVDVLVIATSGRFTTDAVAWVEKHNQSGARPRIEMWPESHLESLLARRSHLVAEFKLR
jgi:hypothetical protein